MPLTSEPSAPMEDSVYDAAQASPFQPYEPPPPPEAGKPEDVEPDDQAEPGAPEFDPRWREPFVGLTYLGRLQTEFTLLGHRFVIRSLSTDDHAEIALLVQPYEGTRASSGVYQTAVVAAAVVSVDGEPIVRSLSTAEPSLTERYRYASSQWMPAVRERVWARIFDLEETVRKVLDEMEKAEG